MSSSASKVAAGESTTLHMASLKLLLTSTLLLCMPLTVNTAVAAGWFFLDPVDLTVSFQFNGNQSNYKSSIVGTDKLKTSNYLLMEDLEIGLSGHLVNPKISQFSIMVKPVLHHGLENTGNLEEKTSGKSLNYNFQLGLLQGAKAPIDASLISYSNTSIFDLAFGNKTENNTKSNELILRWKNKAFPLYFSYGNKKYFHLFQSLSGLMTKRDEVKDNIELSAASSKLRISFSHENVDDKYLDRDYSVYRAWLRHRLTWGRNSKLDSIFRAYNRKGFAAYKHLNLTESINIRHTKNLTSTTLYRYNSRTASTKDTTHEGAFSLDHSLYSNLRSSVSMSVLSQKNSAVEARNYQWGGATSYNKAFKFGSISASTYGNLSTIDRVSVAGTAEIINEEHKAQFVNPIILKQNFIDEPSIFVSAQDGFVYTIGIDYQVTRLGGFATEIRILPTGRIGLGEEILVSYTYELQPSSKYKGASIGYALEYSYGVFKLFHNNHQYSASLKAGSTPPPDEERSVTGFELNWKPSAFTASISAEDRYYRRGGIETSNVLLTQNLHFPMTQNFSIGLTASQSFGESKSMLISNRLNAEKSPTSSIDYSSINANANWQLRPNLTVSPSLELWHRKELTRSTTDTKIDNLYYGAGLKVSWLVRDLTMYLDISHNVIDFYNNTTLGSRIFFSARRQFR